MLHKIIKCAMPLVLLLILTATLAVGVSAACVHEYDNGCDASCNLCGAARAVAPHTPDMSGGWIQGDGYHYYPCEICHQPIFTAEHIASGGYQATDTEHFKTCGFCGAEIDKATHVFVAEKKTSGKHSLVCGCGYETDESHVFENSCDTACERCGYIREPMHEYTDTPCEAAPDLGHVGVCECGAVTELLEHQYKDFCDAECNSCGYIRTVTHNFEEFQPAGDTHIPKCALCESLGSPEPHTGGEYLYNALGHWQSCTACGEYLGIKAHLSELRIGTDGEEEYVCVCGYRESVPQNPDGEVDNAHTLLVVIISLASGVAVCALAVIAFIKRDAVTVRIKKIKDFLKKAKK